MEQIRCNISEELLIDYSKYDIDVASDKELLSVISDELLEKKVVKDGFKEAILQREKDFPTGLVVGKYAFAIPHTDAKYVNTPGVILISLKNKVKFTVMATNGVYADVKIIFLLLLKNNGSQIELLQSLMKMCTCEGMLERLESATSKENLIKTVNDYFKEKSLY